MGAYERWWDDKSDRVTVDQKFFWTMYMKYGLKIAFKMSRYRSIEYCRRLLHHPHAEEFMLGLINEGLRDIQVTVGDLIKRRLAIADDINVDAKYRDGILKDLIGMAERSESDFIDKVDRYKREHNKPQKEK